MVVQQVLVVECVVGVICRVCSGCQLQSVQWVLVVSMQWVLVGRCVVGVFCECVVGVSCECVVGVCWWVCSGCQLLDVQWVLVVGKCYLYYFLEKEINFLFVVEDEGGFRDERCEIKFREQVSERFRVVRFNLVQVGWKVDE